MPETVAFPVGLGGEVRRQLGSLVEQHINILEFERALLGQTASMFNAPGTDDYVLIIRRWREERLREDREKG
jgi:hypothetical protein